MEKRRKYYKRSEDYIPKIYKPTDLEYMAGIVDGEGCFWIGLVSRKYKNNTTKNFRGVLKIDNTDKRLNEWIDSVFSGTASARTRSTSSRKFEREIFTWVATGDRLLDICEQLLPYLILKKQQCEIMIKFRKSYTGLIGSNKLSKETIEVRQKCIEDIRKLNSRWHLHPLKNPETVSLVPVAGS